MASRKRIKVVRGFRGTRHHGLAPGRKAKPIIKESCSPALGHGPGRVPRGEVAAASQGLDRHCDKAGSRPRLAVTSRHHWGGNQSSLPELLGGSAVR
jgi:hypothetical protein